MIDSISFQHQSNKAYLSNFSTIVVICDLIIKKVRKYLDILLCQKRSNGLRTSRRMSRKISKIQKQNIKIRIRQIQSSLQQTDTNSKEYLPYDHHHQKRKADGRKSMLRETAAQQQIAESFSPYSLFSLSLSQSYNMI